jgi:hypothetical protein
MLISKQATLKNLLESKEGVHLTAYLVNRGDLVDLKRQLRTTISEAYQWLHSAMTSDERNRFLEPLDSLLSDVQVLKQIKGNIGIFRNESSFRILNIPIDVEQSCLVATSFHVKPLLRWLQGDQEFLLLGLEKESAHLYLGSQDSFKLVDSILFPEFFKVRDAQGNPVSARTAHQNKTKERETFSWVNDWILELTRHSKPKLFVAGEPMLVQALSKNLSYKNAIKTPVSHFFSREDASDSLQTIRSLLKSRSQKSFEKALNEFRFAEAERRARTNIFQITKAVVQGRVRKLIVTDEVSIFGKIDQKSGGLAIHPFDQDHEDDCVLDDLAQMVLSQGGKVIVAKKNEMPNGRLILAILDDEDSVLEKVMKLQDESFQQRVG